VPEETETFEAELSVDQVKECMMELPDNARTILSLYLLEGYDHEEISQILNITNSTSRSQYARARKKLQDKIKEKIELTQV